MYGEKAAVASVTTPPVKMRLERSAERDKREIKNNFSAEYAHRMAATLGIEGTDDELTDMFGIGCWKYDPEAAVLFLSI